MNCQFKLIFYKQNTAFDTMPFIKTFNNCSLSICKLYNDDDDDKFFFARKKRKKKLDNFDCKFSDRKIYFFDFQLQN